jgi:hypothetical protein
LQQNGSEVVVGISGAVVDGMKIVVVVVGALGFRRKMTTAIRETATTQ